MERVVHHGRGQSVETSEICQHTTGTLRRVKHDNALKRRTNKWAVSNAKTETDSRYLYYICVYYVVLWEEPVSHLLLSHRRCKLETFQVFL